RRGLGRGKGFAYEYPDGSAEFAAAIARELPRCRTLDLAAKAAFAHGTSPAMARVLYRLLGAPYENPRSSLIPRGTDPHRAAIRLADGGSRRASRLDLYSEIKPTLDRPGDLNTMLRGTFDFL